MLHTTWSQRFCFCVCGTRGSLRTMHGGGSAPSCSRQEYWSGVPLPSPARFPSHEAAASGDAGHSPDRRYAMVLFRITSVFYMLWLPYIIYFLLESSRVLDNPTLSFLTTWLAISNSFCNCVIYSLSNSVFRLGLRRLSETMCTSCMCVKDKDPEGRDGP